MGKYPEAEARDCTVVDLESYRRRRKSAEDETNASQPPPDAGKQDPGIGTVPVEGNRKD
jgi:hypothetical protein